MQRPFPFRAICFKFIASRILQPMVCGTRLKKSQFMSCNRTSPFDGEIRRRPKPRPGRAQQADERCGEAEKQVANETKCELNAMRFFPCHAPGCSPRKIPRRLQACETHHRTKTRDTIIR